MKDFPFDDELVRAQHEDRTGVQWAILSIARSLREIAQELKDIHVILEPGLPTGLAIQQLNEKEN